MLVGTNGIRINLESVGNGDAVVLLHAAGLDSSQWQPQIAHLQSRYRCVTLDLRNHGRSDTTYGPLSLRLFAADVLGAMDAAEVQTAHLVGASLGANIACQIAVVAPERVQSITMLSTFLREADMTWVAPLRDGGYGDDEQDAVKRAMFASRTWNRRRDVVDNVLSKRESRDPLLRHAFPGVLRATLEPLWAELPGIAAPMLSLHGAEDRVASPTSMGERLREHVASAKVVTVPDAALFANLENDEFVNACIDEFLATTAGDAKQAEARP